MLDRYQLDDVLAPPRRLRKSSPASQAESAGAALVTAALDFDSRFDLQYQNWLEADYSALLEKHLNFSSVAQTQPTLTDWQELVAGIQLALLCGDSDQSRLAGMDAWLAHCPSATAAAVRSTIAFFTHHPQQSIDLYLAGCGATDGSALPLGSLPRGLPSAIYALALIQQTTQGLSGKGAEGYNSGDKRQLEKLTTCLGALADQYQGQYRGDCFMPVLRVLTDFVRVRSGQRKAEQTFWLGGLHVDASPGSIFF